MSDLNFEATIRIDSEGIYLRCDESSGRGMFELTLFQRTQESLDIVKSIVIDVCGIPPETLHQRIQRISAGDQLAADLRDGDSCM